MSKKDSKPGQDDEADITSRDAVLAAEREAEERYQKEQAEKRARESEDPVYKTEEPPPVGEVKEGEVPEVPARFTTGGASYEEKQAWYRANRPELADPEPQAVEADKSVREKIVEAFTDKAKE